MNTILTYLRNIFSSTKEEVGNRQLFGVEKAATLLQDLIDVKKIPGLAITVAKENTVRFQKGYGHTNLENQTPVNPKTTVFRIASVSKPIAATALAHMVAEKKIALDASFYSYVPYYPKKEWDFTIRQLASHTAGIRGYKGMEYGLNKPYSIKESIAIFKDDDLLFKPGTSYHYNSFDWVLISLAMQEVCGIPFEDYVMEKVLKPLGMINTFSETMTSASLSHQEEERSLSVVNKSQSHQEERLLSVAEVSKFYSRNKLGFREAIPVNNFYKLAGGGYLSTTEDIVKLGQAYLENRILNDEVLNQFITSENIEGKPTYYGLGWQVSEDKNGKPYYGHIGNGVGGYSNFYVYPKEKLVISILVNCTNPNIQEVLDEVIAIFVSGKDKAIS